MIGGGTRDEWRWVGRRKETQGISRNCIILWTTVKGHEKWIDFNSIFSLEIIWEDKWIGNTRYQGDHRSKYVLGTHMYAVCFNKTYMYYNNRKNVQKRSGLYFSVRLFNRIYWQQTCWIYRAREHGFQIMSNIRWRDFVWLI